MSDSVELTSESLNSSRRSAQRNSNPDSHCSFEEHTYNSLCSPQVVISNLKLQNLVLTCGLIWMVNQGLSTRVNFTDLLLQTNSSI